MNSWTPIVLGGVGFALQAIVMSFIFARKLSEAEAMLRRTIGEHQESDSREFAKIREEAHQEADQARRHFGETITAIRSKVNQVELFVRDEFPRKGDLDRVEKRLIRIEDGIIQERKGRG